MSSTAVVITVAYAIAVAIGSVISFAVWASTRPAEDGVDGTDTATWGRREKTWLLIVVAALFALLMATIFYVPYRETAGPDAQVVKVVGVQYGWAMEPAEVVAGRQVEFWLESAPTNGQPAVQHGFGVYDPDGALVLQAQVAPGLRQKVVHTFTRPGTYEVLCLEFCGAKHHEMKRTFEVVG